MIEIKGMPLVLKNLSAIERREAKKIIRQENRQSCKDMLAALKPRLNRKSGKLVKGLKVRALKRSTVNFGYKVATWIPDTSKQKPFYGGLVDLGHKTKNGKKIRGQFKFKSVAKDSVVLETAKRIGKRLNEEWVKQ